MKENNFNKEDLIFNYSKPEVGEDCIVNFGGCGIILNCKVSSKKYTDFGKVFYDVKFKPFKGEDTEGEYQTEIKDIDGYFIEREQDRFTGKSNMPFNYQN